MIEQSQKQKSDILGYVQELFIFKLDPVFVIFF
jgi:hypothetical protein